MSAATLLSLLPAGCAAVGISLVALGDSKSRNAGVALVAAYGVTVTGSAALSAIRFRSLSVGLLAVPGLVATHAAYMGGFLDGAMRRR